MNSGVDAKFAKGLALVFMTLCVCGFMIYAFCGFYNALRTECFPDIDDTLDLAIKMAVGCSGAYLGLMMIGVRGLKSLSSAFAPSRGINMFTGMFD